MTFRHVGKKVSGVVNVVFVSNPAIRRMKRRYFGINRVTDVIAFRYDELGKVPVSERPFGDMFISADQAKKQARNLRHSFLWEILLLTAHGALHLLDYRDDTPRRRARMWRIQEEALKKAGNVTFFRSRF